VPHSAWKRKSGRSLVKLLALQQGHSLHREQIQAALWPDLDERAAADGFRHALHTARRIFEPELPPKGTSSYLQVTQDVVRLAPDRVWIDVDQFEELAAHALSSDDPARHEAALAAYGGELLREDRYVEWVAQRRDTLAQRYSALLLGLADLLDERGDIAGAIE
jgi:DNA-binding SARP family transcriptional activator